MSKIQIVSRWDSAKVLFECDAPEGLSSGLHMRHALEKATEARAYLRDANLSDAYLSGADLRDANLSGAYLSGADLSGAYLRGADLRGADLRGAYLRGADLRGAYLSGADLSGAYLRDANLSGAYLRDANLSGAYLSDANLSGAYLSDANLSDAYLRDAPTIPNIHQTVYAAACVPGALDMGSWHCGTTHCRAGWVVTLAGEDGKALEEKIGTPLAAMSIYMASDPDRWKTERLPNFYCGSDKALEDMKRMAEEEAAKEAS